MKEQGQCKGDGKQGFECYFLGYIVYLFRKKIINPIVKIIALIHNLAYGSLTELIQYYFLRIQIAQSKLKSDCNDIDIRVYAIEPDR